ncbi:MAG TPA: peptidase M75 [Maribacter sp.]|uniref:imelysin family protein n=1 Tax=unclassified Maribacter TaxID=2615042 RepID=UPI000EE05F41|nr:MULTISPECIES: imelysin family protein [unclassified Maribacter]HAF76167.1 peptidase M75 [Maribacter sp.]|tara:strand:- start:88211 stop:89341 length:1131 start_codon:yes stop_codon:yes gene_type:complete
MKKIIGILCVLALVWACSNDSETDDSVIVDPVEEVSFERSTMLVNWADNIIIPSYQAFTADMDDLLNTFNTFKADVNEGNLIALRASWLNAYKSWQHVEMFEIGPAESVGFQLNMNIYPTDNEKIDGFIVNGSYDLSLSSNRSAKGFPALDYLLNGLGDTDADILAFYNGDNKEAYLQYTEDVLMDMQSLTETVVSDWTNGYRDTFVANDGASSTASVDRMVNDYIFYYEKYLRAGKMGIPLGVFSGSTLPRNVEAYYEATISNDLFLEGLSAVQDFFNGNHFNSSTQGESLASYLDALNTLKNGEDLSTLINDQFNTAKNMVLDLSAFRAEIENSNPPTSMLLAYDEVQKAVPMLKVDMVSAMSISIDFVDADGD